MSFKDHFSGHASMYAAARPTYPPALFAWLAAQIPNHARAWDAGCGNGQASAALAVFGYARSAVTPVVDLVFAELHDRILRDDWPPERVHVTESFHEMPFPFPEARELPAFDMSFTWDLSQYLAYLRTWSAVQCFMRRTGQDPVAFITADMSTAWGDPASRRTVRWPLMLRFGRCP